MRRFLVWVIMVDVISRMQLFVVDLNYPGITFSVFWLHWIYFRGNKKIPPASFWEKKSECIFAQSPNLRYYVFNFNHQPLLGSSVVCIDCCIVCLSAKKNTKCAQYRPINATPILIQLAKSSQKISPKQYCCIGNHPSGVRDFRFLLAPRLFGLKKTHMALSVKLMELGFSRQPGDPVTQVRHKGMCHTLHTLSTRD